MKYLLVSITAGLASWGLYHAGNLYVESLVVAGACATCYGIGYYYGSES